MMRDALPYKVGDRIGKLVIVERVAGGSKGRRWLCECDCGGASIRYSAEIARATRDGLVVACRECTFAAVSELRARIVDARRGRWTKTWARLGTIWSAKNEMQLEHRVGRDLAEAGHLPPRPAFPMSRGELLAIGAIPSAAEVIAAQRIAYLYPLDGRGSLEWNCHECGARFERGLGCIACLEPVCRPCVRAEKHVCAESYGNDRGMTRDELGRQMPPPDPGAPWRGSNGGPVSRERARQIEAVALRNLRKALEALDIP
jgi:hypothetical protein